MAQPLLSVLSRTAHHRKCHRRFPSDHEHALSHKEKTRDSLNPRRNTITQLTHMVRSLWRKDDGQDLLEYALLVALIAIVAVAAITLAGTQVSDIFNQIAAAI